MLPDTDSIFDDISNGFDEETSFNKKRTNQESSGKDTFNSVSTSVSTSSSSSLTNRHLIKLVKEQQKTNNVL